MKPFDMNTLFLTTDEKNLEFFQALGSEKRLAILRLLKNQDRSIKELSQILSITPAITTRHVKTLEHAGLVDVYIENGRHGLSKKVRLKLREAQIIFNNNYEEEKQEDCTQIDIPICSYSSYDIEAPCGMATPEAIFGRIDDPRYFSAPNRYDISLLWFTSGYLDYPIPTFDIDIDNLKEIEITFEICSEYPGFNNSFKSDIYFYFNSMLLCCWTCPGDFGGRKGMYTPMWWNLGTEFGLLKRISIDEKGVEMDGIHVSDRPLHEFIDRHENSFHFKIDCPHDTRHPGGCNLFGKRFGDFDQNILVKCYYAHPGK